MATVDQGPFVITDPNVDLEIDITGRTARQRFMQQPDDIARVEQLPTINVITAQEATAIQLQRDDIEERINDMRQPEQDRIMSQVERSSAAGIAIASARGPPIDLAATQRNTIREALFSSFVNEELDENRLVNERNDGFPNVVRQNDNSMQNQDMLVALNGQTGTVFTNNFVEGGAVATEGANVDRNEMQQIVSGIQVTTADNVSDSYMGTGPLCRDTNLLSDFQSMVDTPAIRYFSSISTMD